MSDVEDDNPEGDSAMDVASATRTLREVNQDLKRVELDLEKVEDALDKLEGAEEAYRKNNNGNASVKWQRLQSKLKRLQRKENVLLEERKGLSLQQHTAPSSGKTPTDTHTTRQSSPSSLALRWAAYVELAVLAVLCWLCGGVLVG